MPIDVRFDEDRRMLRVRVSARWPTLPEIIAERSRLIVAGYIRSDVVELVDARALTRGIPTLAQIKGILNSIGAPPLKCAVLVNSALLQYCAGRVAEALDPYGVRVFRDESAAMDWLFQADISHEPAQATL